MAFRRSGVRLPSAPYVFYVNFEMSYFLYILKSESTNRSYIGQTSDLEKRLWEHNNGKSLSTRRKGPWKLVYYEEFATRSGALMRERYFKSVPGRLELSSKVIV